MACAQRVVRLAEVLLDLVKVLMFHGRIADTLDDQGAVACSMARDHRHGQGVLKELEVGIELAG